MAFELRITTAGRDALADGDNRGTRAIQLTKMAIGDGSGTGGETDDSRTALRNQRAVAALGGSTTVSDRIAVVGVFTPAAAYGVTEVGILGRVGTEAEFLVAYWTAGGARLASTVADTRLVIGGSLDIEPAEAEITVTVDTLISLGDPTLSASLAALADRVSTLETDELSDTDIGDKAFSNPPSDLTAGEKTSVRMAIGAGTSSAASLSDTDIGDKAFSNPPSDLTADEKTSVRTAIGAGTSSAASLSDTDIGDKAFSNPPSDLTADEKTSVRTAIGAGTDLDYQIWAGSQTDYNDIVSKDASTLYLITS